MHTAIKKWLIGALIIATFFGLVSKSNAGIVDDLKNDLQAKNAEIKRLEEEANKFRSAIATKQTEGKTLTAELNRINRTINKLELDIALTERNIEKTDLEIDQLAIEIDTQKTRSETIRSGLGSIVRALSEYDRASLVEILLKNPVLSTFFQQLDYITILKQQMLTSVATIRQLQKNLAISKASAEEKKTELINLDQTLSSQQNIQKSEKSERNTLLAQTKSEEQKYQALLREREKQRKALEEEIKNIEEQIRVTVDPSSLPMKRAGVLGDPLPDVSLESCWKEGGLPAENCVTQYFGNTSFAQRGGYSGNGHNGVDFRAEVGTPILAAAGGVVEAWGDTDFTNIQQGIGCRDASYGKWVLIRHPTNISTLYAHLSSITVTKGQEVTRAERIGFSGRSGYATGPHLHFTVFATRASEIKSFTSRVCGRTLTIPFAHPDWYLNPLDYL